VTEILHCAASQFLALFTGSKMSANWIKGKWDDNICCKKYSLVILNPDGRHTVPWERYNIQLYTSTPLFY